MVPLGYQKQNRKLYKISICNMQVLIIYKGFSGLNHVGVKILVFRLVRALKMQGLGLI